MNLKKFTVQTINNRSRLCAFRAFTLLTAFALLPLFTLPAMAQISSGANIVVSDNTTTAGTGWTFASNVFTINNGAFVTLTGSTSTNRIEVNGTATVTLNGVSVTDVFNPFVLNSGAIVTLHLADASVNTFTALTGAGIRTTGATLTILGTGSLSAQGAPTVPVLAAQAQAQAVR